MSATLRLGFDFGGTKIEGIALASNGVVVARQRISTPQGSYLATLDALQNLAEQLYQQAGGRGPLGMAMRGSVQTDAGRVFDPLQSWLNNQNIASDLAARLGQNVRIANDANCFALSEACDGAAQNAQMVLGLILGTGCGAGLVFNQQIWAGRNAVAGEWGHTPLPWPQPNELPGPSCHCGKPGCIEMWCSGPGLAADHKRITGDALEAPAIVAAAEAGHAQALASMQRYTERLGRCLAVLINILDPEIIVLGGGMSNVASLYRDLPEAIQRWTFLDKLETKIVQAQHGDASGVRGAAWLV